MGNPRSCDGRALGESPVSLEFCIVEPEGSVWIGKAEAGSTGLSPAS